MSFVAEQKPPQFSRHSRVLIVSCAPPVRVQPTADGSLKLERSSGGLASALRGLDSTERLWLACMRHEDSEERQVELSNRLWEDYQVVPIYTPKQMIDGHYKGISNNFLWFLLHGLDDMLKDKAWNEDDWEKYKDANRLAAKIVAEWARDGDMIWIHDYHYMLLPGMLREKLSSSINVRIGFFFHTPFRNSEPPKVFPVWKDVLRGVLGSDLIGFHTETYKKSFKRACESALGLPTTPTGVNFKGRRVKLEEHPIGINPAEFHNVIKKPSVKRRIAELDREFKDKKVIIGIDRLDPIKGLPEKLRAFKCFLERQPAEVGRVVLIQVAVPSREDLPEYQRLRKEIATLVDGINKQFGNSEFKPLRYCYESMDFDELVAHYVISHVCLVTSICDGMNLVSFEYIATQHERKGVLCLSEHTGAAHLLEGGALTFDPHNTDETASRIYEALSMEPEDRASLHERSDCYVTRDGTVSVWLQRFLINLRGA